MLILSRRAGDSLMIGGGVRIVVLGVEGSSVRLGIDAPIDVRVLRGEILAQVERENERARVSLASRAAED
ncbi:MAG: carbon storage regulator CsrA [Gemmatimonadales bacterium]